jgi:hypothetical protein
LKQNPGLRAGVLFLRYPDDVLHEQTLEMGVESAIRPDSIAPHVQRVTGK